MLNSVLFPLDSAACSSDGVIVPDLLLSTLNTDSYNGVMVPDLLLSTLNTDSYNGVIVPDLSLYLPLIQIVITE